MGAHYLIPNNCLISKYYPQIKRKSLNFDIRDLKKGGIFI
jgi:hypothetical protein